VGQVHELQAEDPVRSGFGVNPLTLVLGVVGAFIVAVALSALFAHPAGGSTPLGETGVSTIAAVGQNVGQPAVAAVDALNGVAAAPRSASPGLASATGANAAVGPIVTLLRLPGSALHGLALAPVIQSISPPIAPPLGPVVTTLTPVSTPATGTAPPTTGGLETTTGSAGGPPAFGLRTNPGAPHPAPAPPWPFQRFPLVTNTSPTADPSLSPAGYALAAAPASGPLLPDPPVSGVIPAQSRIPRFLFDLRSSPPG
jgi:hypothetical protein